MLGRHELGHYIFLVDNWLYTEPYRLERTTAECVQSIVSFNDSLSRRTGRLLSPLLSLLYLNALNRHVLSRGSGILQEPVLTWREETSHSETQKYSQESVHEIR
jgi:hypothetical protein